MIRAATAPILGDKLTLGSREAANTLSSLTYLRWGTT